MFCKSCKSKNTCQETCQDLNKYFKSVGIYGDNYKHKRRETPLDNIAKIAIDRAFKLKYGRKISQFAELSAL